MENSDGHSGKENQSEGGKLQKIEQNLSCIKTFAESAESLVNTIPDGLLVLDMELRVEMANGPFYQIFQMTPEMTEPYL